MLNKRGQVTIFIIVALTIVVGGVIFIVVSNSLKIQKIPENIQPLYNDFLSCLQDKTNLGIKILGNQGGYIFPVENQDLSFNNPFSSTLNFFGIDIPYWYYFSSSNLEKEKIPSKEEMESELAKFLEQEVKNCDLQKYYDSGFDITQNEPEVLVTINDHEIETIFKVDMRVNTSQDNVLIKDYSFKTKTELGKLYNSALKIYNQEQQELFLEEYTIDTLRLYAPVDGFELSCSPKTWNIYEINDNLRTAIQENTLALTNIVPSNSQNKYFFLDLDIDENVKLFNFFDWPNYLEVNPSKDSLLVANPVGTQEGFNALGFCYVPYHFVYNLKYPVLIQVSKGEEVFQFPIIVSIKGNKPRVALNASAVSAPESNICEYRNTFMSVRTLDRDLNVLNSSISFSCLGEECLIGQTNGEPLNDYFPQCVNGNLIINSPGYAQKIHTLNSVNEGQLDIILDRAYPIDVEVNFGNILSKEKAIIYLVSNENSETLIYPENNKINLSEGTYNITVYVYANGSLELPESTTQQCSDIPANGIAGLFGAVEKNCVDVKTPSQTISNLLIGGGKLDNHFISDESLENSKTLVINVEQLTRPTSIKDIQKNYMLVEASDLNIDLI